MIVIKSREEIEKIRVSSRICVYILQELGKSIKPGIYTKRLEEISERIFKEKNCIPAFKGYRGYPSSVCVSVNDAVVHGIPDGYCLREGDIVSIDIGVLNDGYYGDTAGTFAVGKISKDDRRLIDTTKKALDNAISQAVVGNHLGDISYAVEYTAKQEGFSVVRDFVGHGIGQQMHEDPQIPNFGFPGKGPELKQGMVLAIEPMVNFGTHKVKIEKDGWTVKTLDGSKSAHFEHTIVVLDSGPEILTTTV